MGGKKVNTRFNIFLNKSDPTHIRVAEIINSQGYRVKAKYIVQAILFYEGYSDISDTKNQIQFDKNVIKSAANKNLNESKDTFNKHPQYSSKRSSENVINELSEDGLNTVLNILDMFKNKN